MLPCIQRSGPHVTKLFTLFFIVLLFLQFQKKVYFPAKKLFLPQVMWQLQKTFWTYDVLVIDFILNCLTLKHKTVTILYFWKTAEVTDISKNVLRSFWSSSPVDSSSQILMEIMLKIFGWKMPPGGRRNMIAPEPTRTCLCKSKIFTERPNICSDLQRTW